MADVTYEREDFTEYKFRAETVTDVIEHRVKDKGFQYLEKKIPGDENKKLAQLKNAAYLRRALFVNFSAHTLNGLVGAAFVKVPQLQVNSAIEYVNANIDGAGLSIFQQSQKALMNVLGPGRFGLFVDYPKDADRFKSEKEKRDNCIRPTCIALPGILINNWKTETVGGICKLRLVTFRSDTAKDTVDGFGEELIPQYTVLRLIEGIYTIERYRKNQSGAWVLHETYQPTDGFGNAWEEIPFTFIGPQNNDSSIDPSPIYPMVEMNLAHYENYAIHQDAVIKGSTLQSWMSGLSQADVDAMSEAGVYFGNEELWAVPSGGQAGLLQGQPTTMAMDTMKMLVEWMVAMGARLITPGSAVRTATEAEDNNETQHSVLSLAVSNVSEAYVQVLQWMHRYMGVEDEAIYAISQEFTRAQMSPQLLLAFKGLLETGEWPRSEFWRALRKIELIDPEKDDDTIKDELESSPMGLGLDQNTITHG